MGGEPYTWRRVSTVRRQAVGNLPPKGGTAPTAEPTSFHHQVLKKNVKSSLQEPVPEEQPADWTNFLFP